jgi:hypothetical protein
MLVYSSMVNNKCIKISEETFNLLVKKEAHIKKLSPNYVNVTHDYVIAIALHKIQ